MVSQLSTFPIKVMGECYKNTKTSDGDFLNKHRHQRERAVHCHQDTSVHLYDLI
uniref:Uncharacterized protein n=1 Tax=Anguilla anguilla TaxID=7936 RepID=A0A0E9PCV7_ANGAN